VAQEQSLATSVSGPPGARAGIIIAVCAVLTLVAISFHPVVQARAPADVLAGVVALSAADRVVHGTLIALMGALLFSFWVFALRRGIQHETVLAGLIAYAVGVLALLGAALVDGFIIPDVAARYAGAPPDAVKSAVPMLVLCGAVIQDLSKLGMVALSLGIALWGSDLLRRGMQAPGVLGIAAGLADVALVALGGHLNPHSLLLIVGAQAAWYAVVAALLIRGRV
jgi:hypothetical protein